MKDEFGNKITVRGDVIYLELAGRKTKRQIGTIMTGTKRLLVHRKRGVHLMQKKNSYGFNHFILKNATKFDKLLVKDEGGLYQIPVNEILENGTFSYFKQQGFERQIFYPLDKLIEYRHDR